jgi:hypothetical protein
MCASRYEVLDPVREVFSLNLLSMVEPLHNDMPVSNFASAFIGFTCREETLHLGINFCLELDPMY